jgi:hypothetical protein
MKVDWRNVIVGGMMGVVTVGTTGIVGCATQPAADPAESRIEAQDPNARAFHGTIVSLRPMKSTMLISKDDRIGNDRFPNIITVKYDAQTKFILDGAPATLDQIQRYMNVQVTGQMRDGQLFAEIAKFSSVAPAPAPKPSGTAQAQ